MSRYAALLFVSIATVTILVHELYPIVTSTVKLINTVLVAGH